MPELAAQDVSTRLSLEASACLTIRRPDAACDVCAAICPAGAITVDTRAVELDHDNCTSCGRCVASCPTGALTHPAIHLDPTPEALILECSRVAAGDRMPDARVVPCLGGVAAVQLLEALVTTGTVALVDRGWCTDCASGGCPQPWAEAVRAVTDDLALLDRRADGVSVASAPLPQERAQPAPQPRRPVQRAHSRRQFFHRLTTPPPAPDRRRLTGAPFAGKTDAPALEARRHHLRALHERDPLPAELFPGLKVTGAPVLRLAATLCPTNALHLLEAADADRLVFDAALCIACGACEAAGGLALHPRGHGTYAGPATLASQAMADCPRCLRRFAPVGEQRICDGCHKDDDLAADAFGLMRRYQVPYGA